MKKATLMIIIVALSISFTSCKDGGYKSGGVDFKGHEIIYRILTKKQVEQTEKIVVIIDALPSALVELTKECNVVAEVKIKDIDTVSFRRKESIMKRDHYFSILNGVITNIYKGKSLVNVGDKINIETDESFVYMQDLEMHLVEGKRYYMFLRDRGDHWTNKLVEYTLILDTNNYEHMMSLLEE